MKKEAKTEALHKKLDKMKCKECGSRKHSTKEHEKFEHSEEDEEKDREAIDEE